MSQSTKNSVFIGLIAAFSFVPFLGGVHLFDWDEINFAEIAREMVLLGEYLRVHINYLVFSEKPPLFFWMQAASMNAFGIGEFGARFPNAICGVVTLITLYKIGEKLKGPRFGWLWAGAFYGAILPNLYFKSGIIDPWFNYFIFMGLYHLILFHWKKNDVVQGKTPQRKYYYLVLAAVFTGLGILTKGPVAYLITGLVLGTYWIFERFRFYINGIEALVYTILAFGVTLTWFGAEFIVSGPGFIEAFTIRQWELFSTPDAGHGGFPGYHFVVLLIGCFPISIFLIKAHGKLFLKDRMSLDMKRWMMILFWVVLILFTIVRSKIVHYSSMTYFPMSFLVALVIHQAWEGKVVITRWMRVSLLVLALIMGSVVIALPFVGMNVDLIKPLFQQDKFALANLDAEVPWTGLESVSGFLLIGITIAFLVYLLKGKYKHAYITLFGGMGVFVFLTLVLVIGKIERISQRAAIDFYESKVGCDCYVEPEGFKSYGQLFYTKRKPGFVPPEHHHENYKQWLLEGDLDKDAFFVSKVTTDQKLRDNPEMQFLYSKNGFTFWKRPASD